MVRILVCMLALGLTVALLSANGTDAATFERVVESNDLIFLDDTKVGLEYCYLDMPSTAYKEALPSDYKACYTTMPSDGSNHRETYYVGLYVYESKPDLDTVYSAFQATAKDELKYSTSGRNTTDLDALVADRLTRVSDGFEMKVEPDDSWQDKRMWQLYYFEGDTLLFAQSSDEYLEKTRSIIAQLGYGDDAASPSPASSSASSSGSSSSGSSSGSSSDSSSDSQSSDSPSDSPSGSSSSDDGTGSLVGPSSPDSRSRSSSKESSSSQGRGALIAVIVILSILIIAGIVVIVVVLVKSGRRKPMQPVYGAYGQGAYPQGAYPQGGYLQPGANPAVPNPAVPNPVAQNPAVQNPAVPNPAVQGAYPPVQPQWMSPANNGYQPVMPPTAPDPNMQFMPPQGTQPADVQPADARPGDMQQVDVQPDGMHSAEVTADGGAGAAQVPPDGALDSNATATQTTSAGAAQVPPDGAQPAAPAADAEPLR